MQTGGGKRSVRCSGCSGDQYAQLNNTLVGATGGASPFISTAIAGPQVGSRGLESGCNLLHGCKDHRMDLAIQRNIRVGGGKMIVFRADIYNAFKAVVINGRQSTLQMNTTADQTVRNSQFLADGSVDPARLLPNNAGFGAATGAADSFNGSNALRSVQLQIKFVF